MAVRNLLKHACTSSVRLPSLQERGVQTLLPTAKLFIIISGPISSAYIELLPRVTCNPLKANAWATAVILWYRESFATVSSQTTRIFTCGSILLSKYIQNSHNSILQSGTTCAGENHPFLFIVALTMEHSRTSRRRKDRTTRAKMKAMARAKFRLKFRFFAEIGSNREP